MPYYDTVNNVKEKQIGISTTWTALRCGNSNMVGRKYIWIMNRGPNKVFWTADENNKNVRSCRVLAPNDTIVLPYSDKVTVWARTASSGTKLIIAEEY